jgi:hypothetical protein
MGTKHIAGLLYIATAAMSVAWWQAANATDDTTSGNYWLPKCVPSQNHPMALHSSLE